MKRTLTQLVASRVPNDARIAESAVGPSREDRLAVIAIVPNEMRRSVVSGPLLEKSRSGGWGVEEPLLQSGISDWRGGKTGGPKLLTLRELSPPEVIISGCPWIHSSPATGPSCAARTRWRRRSLAERSKRAMCPVVDETASAWEMSSGRFVGQRTLGEEDAAADAPFRKATPATSPQPSPSSRTLPRTSPSRTSKRTHWPLAKPTPRTSIAGD